MSVPLWVEEAVWLTEAASFNVSLVSYVSEDVYYRSESLLSISKPGTAWFIFMISNKKNHQCRQFIFVLIFIWFVVKVMLQN